MQMMDQADPYASLPNGIQHILGNSKHGASLFATQNCVTLCVLFSSDPHLPEQLTVVSISCTM
jgi:hypothetical protein